MKNIFKGLVIFSIVSIFLLIVYPNCTNHVVYGAGEAGTVDSSFFNGTRPGADHEVYDVIQQSDGKIILVGDFTTYMGRLKEGIVRINMDGSIDTTFDVGGGITGSRIETVALQSDGKVLIGGSITAYDGVTRNGIVRLNSDGSLDATFDSSVGIGIGSVNAIAVQSDGKIVIGGVFTTYNGTARKNIARLNTDGSLDTSFDPGSGPNNTINSIVIQSSGLIVIAGPFATYNGISAKMIARLNTNGSLDGTFASGTGFVGSAMWELALQSDDKIVAGGYFSSYNGTTRNKIARINADGSLDDTFNPGTGANKAVNGIDVRDDGKILIGGVFGLYNGITRNSVALLDSSGGLDTTFDPGDGTLYGVSTVLFLNNGNILVGGTFSMFNSSYLASVAVLNTDGSVLSSFLDVERGFNDYISAIALQPDGKMVVIGNFSSMNDVPRNKVARLNADGTLDTSFVCTVPFDSYLVTIALQPDGKILIGGSKNVAQSFVRLNTDGSLDDTFITGTGFNDDVNYILIQPDQKILVAGGFTSYNGTNINYIARLNSDGSLDDTFNVGGGPDDEIVAIDLQPDGKILVSGWFYSYDGNDAYYLARLNADGSFDDTFVTGNGLDSTADIIKVLPNGKILFGGSFLEYDGNSSPYLLRLNSDGSFDDTFNMGAGPEDEVFTIALQPDGKILIAGFFYSYDGHDAIGIARLNADGSYDSTFSVGFTKWNDVRALAIQPDGKIILGGKFSSVNDTPAAFLTRVYGSETVVTDEIDPIGSISINAGAASTLLTTVTLTLVATDASGVSKMMICENSEFTGCDWEAYSSSKSYTLSTGNGVKTIYIKYKDIADNVSIVYYDSIILVAPVAEVEEESTISQVEKDTFHTTISVNTAIETQIEDTPAPVTRNVTISVVDQTGQPIVNAYVELNSGEYGYTDALGTVTFKNVLEGAKHIKVRYNDYTTEGTIDVLGTEEGDISTPISTTITLNTQKAVQENAEETESGLSTINIVLITVAGLGILILIIILLSRKKQKQDNF